MFASIIKRNLQKPRFWVLCAAAAGIMAVSQYEKLAAAFDSRSGYDVLDIISSMVMFDRSRAALTGVMAGVCALSFFEERENGYNTYSMMRISPSKYAVAWVTANGCIVMLAAFLSFILFSGCMLLKIPLAKAGFRADQYQPYGEWTSAFPAIYLIIMAFYSGCVYSCLSLLSMICMTFIANKYLAIAVPVIAVEILYNIGLFLPGYLSLYDMGTGRVIFEGMGAGFHLVFSVLWFAIVYIALTAVFLARIEKWYDGKKKQKIK